ncbi:M64 family metallopeptidase [Nonomuraea jiangxiensis]|uniref:IgA Peptidase M64 n=1 Tax=Nonomuraea jiangxiensis TaxID=633440 RepID=A0A1G9C662_9ACTN|nr:M64 family metallopeptidase [Nonomuraea jiangxiensis]SDK47167.1 IgA Peptidase M64 [Nonomuraea jiangxiensis]
MARRKIAAAVGTAGLVSTLLTGAVPAAPVAAATLGTAARAAAEVGSATVVPLQVTGPPQDRLNLIILGDGYTAEEMQQFRDDVDKHLNVQWSIEPFRSYRDYFNVYMIEVVSGVSGISCDPDDGNVRRDTPLKLQYASTCPAGANARGVTFGPGGQDALEQYVSLIPGVTAQNRQTLTLANTSTYGGIGGRNATTTGQAPQGPLVSPHELGHSLGGLQDEYPYSTRNVPGGRHPDTEPSSIHHTRLTTEEMAQQQSKWYRWLGEESLSGGVIDRYESGLSRSENVWRPSEHSIMRWIGYHFDQVGRERMIERISGRRDVAQLSLHSTPTDAPVYPKDVLWVETMHPLYHELTVTWAVNGRTVKKTGNSRNFDLREHRVRAGDTVTVTVSDDTGDVRDPAVADGAALTQTRQWTIAEQPSPAPAAAATTPEFTSSTLTTHPVGGQDVVYVETTHPRDRVLNVTWALNGKKLSNKYNSRNLDLSGLKLRPGTYELTATLSDPASPRTTADQLTWTVDNVAPEATFELSQPVSAVSGSRSRPPQYTFREWFEMGLKATDDQEGYVVIEFQLDGDGWFNYHGWPDAPEGTPYRFTPAGSVIKEIAYGSLGSGGLTKAPFEQSYPDFKPGYGRHEIAFRAIDAAGNISAPKKFTVNVLDTNGATPLPPGAIVVD